MTIDNRKPVPAVEDRGRCIARSDQQSFQLDIAGVLAEIHRSCIVHGNRDPVLRFDRKAAQFDPFAIG